MKKVEVPVWEKANLTVSEAAAYFEIGTKKIRDLARENPNAIYFLWNGSKLLIKRELFEKQCEQWNELWFLFIRFLYGIIEYHMKALFGWERRLWK